MECKHRERDLKLQQACQQSSKQEAKKTTAVKEEVSQKKSGKGDLRVTPAKPPKPMDVVLHAKTRDALQEMHQQQLDKLKRQRMAPIPISLEP